MATDCETQVRDVRAVVQSVVLDVLRRRAAGESLPDDKVIASRPDLAGWLRVELAKLRQICAAGENAADVAGAGVAATTDVRPFSTPGMVPLQSSHFHEQLEGQTDTPLTEIVCSTCGGQLFLARNDRETRLALPLKSLAHFDLIERLGIGGFGTVWKARDRKLDRTVAVKIPHRGILNNDDLEKILREARAAAQLQHPNIVRVHEVGRDGDSVFIVSDFVQGISLDEWLTGQQPTMREAAEICIAIAAALQHAHDRGVIHRDLKPANILIDEHGQPHLMDFGLARREVGEVTVTIDGQVLGTPAYMSPEQAQGESHTADGRSDIYSLGVILFELLTGELPFRGNPRMLMHQVIHDDPPSPRKLNGNIPRDLETITLKCLEKDCHRRFETPSALAADIERFLNHEAIAARPPSAVYRLRKLVRRNAAAVTATAAVALALVIGGGVSTIFGVQANQQSARAVDARKELRNALYAAEMNLVQGAWEARRYDHVRSLLERQRPGPGESDLRGWEWHYWRRQLARGQLSSVKVPGLAVYDHAQAGQYAFTSDGAQLVATGLPVADGPTSFRYFRLAFFDTATGRKQTEFDLEAEQLPLPAIINDDVRIVHVCKGALGRDTVIRDGRMGKEIVTLDWIKNGPPERVFQEYAISPDGALVAVQHMIGPMKVRPDSQQTLYDWETTVFDSATGKQALTLPSKRATGARMLWSSDGTQLLRQGTLMPPQGDDTYRHESQLFDARSGEQLWSRADKTNATYFKAVEPSAWSPDGKLIAVKTMLSAETAAIELWDAATAKTLASLALPDVPAAHDARVVFSPDGRMLAFGDWDGVHVWDLPEVSVAAEQPVEVAAPSLTLVNPDGRLVALSFSKDGRQVRAVTGETITTWDATWRERNEAFKLRGTNRAQFSPDASRLAVGDRNGGVKIWDTATGQPVCSIPYNSPIESTEQKVVFSPDGRRLVIHRFRQVSPPELGERADGYWEYWLHSVEDGRLLAKFDSTTLDRDFVIFSVTFRPDGGQMALVHDLYFEPERPAQLRVWDLKKYVELASVELPWRDAGLLGYSADGTELIVTSIAGDHSLVGTFDAATRSLQSTREFPGNAFRFDATRNRIALHDQADLVFYDFATGKEVLRLQGFDADIRNRAWSPDGRRLAAEVFSGGNRSQIVVWSLESGRRLVTLDSPPLDSLQFSADSHRLLSLSYLWRDGAFTSQVWDATPLPDDD